MSLPIPGENEPKPPLSGEPVQLDPAAAPAREENLVESAQHGLEKCPKCGASDTAFNMATQMLHCRFCRHEWATARLEDAPQDSTSPIHELQGFVASAGAHNIDAQADLLITLKCQGCGAEVVINTETSAKARCHWCRQELSLQSQVPNGAVPDAVLPFKLSKEEAVEKIREFVGERKFFALKQFKKEFEPNNVVGVYLPYMLIDGNLHGRLEGHGEIKTRTYTKGSGKQKYTVYDADVYEISREFAYTVDDLTVESSAERGNMNTDRNTNNVINTILPFDTKNAVEFHASYLDGFTSEKRDVNVNELAPKVRDQFLSIARQRASEDCKVYDRGVRWEREGVQVKGSRWVSVYLPVWLYSYLEVKTNMLHYVAVNARTGEVMGSIPVEKVKLGLVSAALGLGLALAGTLTFGLMASDTDSTYDSPSFQQSDTRVYDPATGQYCSTTTGICENEFNSYGSNR